jgi:mRNA interferase RelE/StbE
LRITFTRSAQKEFDSLDKSLGARVLVSIKKLAKNPVPPGSKKLRNTANQWRIRIGDYRVIYVYDSQARIVDIIAIRHRSNAYK